MQAVVAHTISGGVDEVSDFLGGMIGIQKLREEICIVASASFKQEFSGRGALENRVNTVVKLGGTAITRSRGADISEHPSVGLPRRCCSSLR